MGLTSGQFRNCSGMRTCDDDDLHARVAAARSAAYAKNAMLQALADELTLVIDLAAVELRAINEGAAASKRSPDAWSVKEILGHLVDSAANNHHRFVRAQQAKEFSFPGYEQDVWVQAQDYQSQSWPELVDFWVRYNQHLVHVIRRIPDSAVDVPCRIGANDAVSLGFLVEDYVVHLRHHLKQIQERRAT